MVPFPFLSSLGGRALQSVGFGETGGLLGEKLGVILGVRLGGVEAVGLDVVGDSVGVLVGVTEGARLTVGILDGADDVDGEALIVGRLVGPNVGLEVGPTDIVGSAVSVVGDVVVGVSVAVIVGSADGIPLGIVDGKAVSVVGKAVSVVGKAVSVVGNAVTVGTVVGSLVEEDGANDTVGESDTVGI